MIPILSSLFGDRGLVGSVMDVLKSVGVVKDAEAELKATQALMDFELKTREQEVQIVQAVNATIQAEAHSEDPYVRRWRPTFGYAGVAIIVNNYILMPYLAGFGLKPLEIPDAVWQVILAVLGITALTRGAEKIAREWKRNGS